MDKGRLEELISKKAQLEQVTSELDNYASGLLDKRRELLDSIDLITESKITPLKDEISQIDVALERIIKQSGLQKLESDTYSMHLNDVMSVKILNRDKALQWLTQYPEILKKDIIKSAELKRLISDGVVPDPGKDGIDCNDTYQKVTYRRK